MTRLAARLIAAGAVAICFGGAAPAGQSPPVRARAASTVSTELTAWLFAVSRHTPGQQDHWVATLASWNRGDVNGVVDELKKLLASVDRETRPDTAVWSLPLYPYGVSDVPSLNRLLTRAAILHAEVAFFNHTEAGYSLPPDDRRNIVVADGRTLGTVAGTFHWEAGRTLLDEVRPSPTADDDVRLWYEMTSAMLQRVEDYADLVPHLARARELFPRDAALALYAGTMHENLAEPNIQNTGIKTTQRARPGSPCTLYDCRGSANRQTAPFGAPDSERRQAEMLFREALRLDPALSEARIRLARILGLQGSHAEAVTELQRVLSSERRPLLRYYALGLLGREQQTLGQRDSARIAYEAASALYPTAQSPRLALSQLARDAGDRVQAVAQLDVLRGRGAPSDPWWSYGRTHAPDVFELMRTLAERSRP
jgi:tetratricopeptide (TPR) repeat protein